MQLPCSVFFTQYFCVITQFRAKRGNFLRMFLRNFGAKRRKKLRIIFYAFSARSAEKIYYAICFTHFPARSAAHFTHFLYFISVFKWFLRTLCIFSGLFSAQSAAHFYALFFTFFSPRSGGRKFLRTCFTHFLRFSREARKIFYAFFLRFYAFFPNLKKKHCCEYHQKNI